MEKYNYNADNERCWECDSKEVEGYDFPYYKCKKCGETQHMSSTQFTGFFTDEQWTEYKNMPEEEQHKIYSELTDRLGEVYEDEEEYEEWIEDYDEKDHSNETQL